MSNLKLKVCFECIVIFGCIHNRLRTNGYGYYDKDRNCDDCDHPNPGACKNKKAAVVHSYNHGMCPRCRNDIERNIPPRNNL